MKNNPSITIDGLQFDWNLSKGEFLFEQEDAVLFWITSAMKEFFDTIEEISGEEASTLVFETAGFRQGTVVGKYFEDLKHLKVEEAAEMITATYASAGWGYAHIEDLDTASKTVRVRLKGSWEYKINKAQGKKRRGNFLPAHYAGIFSVFFGQNVWFEIKEDQIAGAETTVIDYFPSTITITENIHALLRKKESQQIMQLEAMVEDKTRDLKELIKQISSPVIPVLDGVVVVPLLGKYDQERAEELVYNTLNKLPSYKANYLVLDLTALDDEVDQLTISLLEKISGAAALIGTETVLVGLSAKLSITIAESGIDISRFHCFQTLQHGIYYALSQQGKQII
ncbi:STAS domain-containing protein [Jeotgalibacillus haloalkalitolerans]|uniref:STAS domain-containing protein n=1 Tax=Jeotgalibacillus haloalkalitolerans TaxID=3104292 RepID=A0ABU5KNN1_9BACL|nr:STAS domain-containing protein [Jeotgalibacillus sp. HH7-29]MDZ5712864.1 STAS domain-containing protein [Jeotgalibacillus sp. HH7-29]